MILKAAGSNVKATSEQAREVVYSGIRGQYFRHSVQGRLSASHSPNGSMTRISRCLHVYPSVERLRKRRILI